jgi:D-alanyl-D-alanine carboxypeptidase/D-alanyl-D-alanine-endopeptidase (penicillin-binding protein 4)
VEVLHDINKRSDNPITRVAYLSLGVGSGDPVMTTAERSERIVREWMTRHGIDQAGLVLENGSGLSRTERITPEQLAGVLKAATASRWSPEFVSSLPSWPSMARCARG